VCGNSTNTRYLYIIDAIHFKSSVLLKVFKSLFLCTAHDTNIKLVLIIHLVHKTVITMYIYTYIHTYIHTYISHFVSPNNGHKTGHRHNTNQEDKYKDKQTL
jgi:hypothetical protein